MPTRPRRRSGADGARRGGGTPRDLSGTGARSPAGRDASIVLIAVWFGPLPFWLPAFLLSCRSSPDVEWLVFTDAPPPPVLPPNVRFVPMDVDTLNRRCAETLGFDVRVQPSLPYKVCDLRPMFGLLFEREIRPFDFWGHCDLDVVWGDIRAFVSREITGRYDVITSRVGRVSGHFCIFRNRPEWARLFREIPDVRRLAEDPRHRNLDEMRMTEALRRHPANAIARALRRLATGGPQPRVYWHSTLTTSGKHQRRLLEDPGLHLLWREGRTFDADGAEMMYLHFHQLRATMRVIDFGFGDAPRAFRIVPAGIFAA